MDFHVSHFTSTDFSYKALVAWRSIDANINFADSPPTAVAAHGNTTRERICKCERGQATNFSYVNGMVLESTTTPTGDHRTGGRFSTFSLVPVKPVGVAYVL